MMSPPADAGGPMFFHARVTPPRRWTPSRGSSRRMGAAFAAALLVLVSGRGEAASPDVIPAMVSWRSAEARSPVEDPLQWLAAGRGASLRAEWAPLYRDARGGRY